MAEHSSRDPKGKGSNPGREKMAIFFRLSTINCLNRDCVNNKDSWYWVGRGWTRIPLLASYIDGYIIRHQFCNNFKLSFKQCSWRDELVIPVANFMKLLRP